MVGGFPEGGILLMLEGNRALECVLFVFVGGGEVVVMMGKMVGEVFNVWRMGSVLIPWVVLSASSIVVGVCALGVDGVAGQMVVVG